MTPIRIVRDPAEMSMLSASWREKGLEVGLVPTMGALHRGHLSLAEEALRMGDRVVASIFVNPKQFGPDEDLDRYPRTLERDLELLEGTGVHCAFVPGADDIYPPGHSTRVCVSDLTETLCGRFRPGHFDGVTTVVTILLEIVAPDFAVFGRKDAQQLAVVRRMVGDLRLGVRIVPAETVREPDGLALSSRNRYLSGEEREQASVIRRSLLKAAAMVEGGETDPSKVIDEVRRTMGEAPLARIQYVELVDPENMRPLERIHPSGLLAVAVYFGDTRLIDNITLEAP